MNEIKLIGQFIGTSKIEHASLAKRKTYLGKDVVWVEFSDGLIMEYPLEVIEKIVTKEATDFEEVVNKTITPVIEKIMVVMTEAEITIDQAKWVLQSKAFISLEANKKMADANLWGKEDYKVTLMDLEQELTKVREKANESNNTTTSKGKSTN